MQENNGWSLFENLIQWTNPIFINYTKENY